MFLEKNEKEALILNGCEICRETENKSVLSKKKEKQLVPTTFFFLSKQYYMKYRLKTIHRV